MSDRALGIYAGIIMIFLLLFAHQPLFDLMDEVLFTGEDAAVEQGNVSGEWADIGISVLWFFVLIFLIVGPIILLVTKGGS